MGLWRGVQGRKTAGLNAFVIEGIGAIYVALKAAVALGGCSGLSALGCV